MSAAPAVATLVPHAGRMCLLERVLDWDESTVTLATTTHRDPANPLRSDGRLRAIHLCEYGAQAVAVHGGLVAHASGGRARPGLLVSMRDVVLHCADVQDLTSELVVKASCVNQGGAAWQYDFRVDHGTQLLARGRVTIALAPGP